MQPAAQPAGTQPLEKPAVMPVRRVGGVHGAVPRLEGMVSIKSTKEAAVVEDKRPERAEKQLTQESLEQYWQQMLLSRQQSTPRIAELFENVKIELQQDNVIVLYTVNTYLEVELKPYAVDVLEELRKSSGVSELNYRVEVEYEATEAVPYTPHEKYDAMMLANPVIAELRKLLPEIDY